MSLVDDICEPGKLTQFATPPSAQDTDEILRRIKADLHPGQLAFVEDTQTEILALTAGYGAGKTTAASKPARLCSCVSVFSPE